MSPLEVAGLVAAGTLAGLVSTVASVASLVSYPVLLAIGLPPLSANVTNTVALLFTAMRLGTDLHVHAELSPSLLRNLEEFQSVWVCWRPAHYAKVEFSADVERDATVDDSDDALTLFSGGVDSSFTARRFVPASGR